MYWESIGATGEVVGAFAVVLTLAYLTMQVRQADLGIRASTYQNLLAERANVNMTISANADLANIVRRGFSGDELDPVFADLVDDFPIDPSSQLDNLVKWMGSSS